MRHLAVFCLAASLPLAGQAADPAPAPEDGSLDCLIEPLRVVQVGSRADGVLEEVLVDRGDTVERGQLLASLDSLPERAALELARQRAREDVAVRSSQVKYEFGQRRAALFADSALESATTDLEKDEASTAARLARLGVDEARANRMIASLEVARVEALLQQRRITSPLDGVVVERLMNPGERVTDSPILTLAQIDPLKVEVIVPVAMLGSMRIGSRAVVTPEAPVAGEYPATVTVVDRVVDARSGTFGVRLELANPDHALPGGLRCRVSFVADDEQPAEAPVPRAAERAPEPAMQHTPTAPAAQPAPREPAPAETPRLHAAEADAAVAPPATPEHTASVADQSPQAPVTASAASSSTLGNLLLPSAAASHVEGEPQTRETAGEPAVATVPAAVARGVDSAAGEPVAAVESSPDPVVDTGVSSQPVADTAALDKNVTPPPAAVLPTPPIRDEAAERALLAALPPLPILGGSLLLDTPSLDTDPAPAADTQPVPQTGSGVAPALAHVTPVGMADDADDAFSSRASRSRAATASHRLRAEEAAGRAASLEPSVPSQAATPGCQALGPIDDTGHAQGVAARAGAAGWETRVVTREDPSTRKRVLTVALLDAGIDATGRALQAKGFRDLHYLDSGPFAGNWSAGVFSNMEFAEHRRGALASAGFQADLQPFGRALKLHWVELKGATLDSDDIAPFGSPPSASLGACER